MVTLWSLNLHYKVVGVFPEQILVIDSQHFAASRVLKGERLLVVSCYHLSVLAMKVYLIESSPIGLGEIGVHDAASLHHCGLLQEATFNDFVFFQIFYK